MELNLVLRDIVNPALLLLPPKMTSYAAKVEMLAIGLQESRFKSRAQIVKPSKTWPDGRGPARGFWQFERGGGVVGVLNHFATKQLALEICAKQGVEPESSVVWAALERDDILAACFARLLLWSDPKALPKDNAQAGWDLYIRTWRPGQPHRHTWDALYKQAQEAVANE